MEEEKVEPDRMVKLCIGINATEISCSWGAGDTKRE